MVVQHGARHPAKDSSAMAQPQSDTKHLPILIAAAMGVMALAGIALVKADEHMGTAHITQTDLIAGHPDKGEDAPVVPEPEAGASYAAPPAFVSADATQAAPKPAPTAAPAAATPAPAPAHAAEQPLLVIKRTLPIKDPIKYGQWFWDEKNAPATGPLIITVDLEARVLSVFRDGVEIGTTAVLLGTQEKPTPLGVFPITQKDAHHVSNLYDAPMPYMMRLTNDGVSIHATNVQNGYASHGCVGVPLGFAQKVFAIAHLGDKVIITRAGKTA
jgi:lipoprotein-anchoring transpeptidase ErfK/SrfK